WHFADEASKDVALGTDFGDLTIGAVGTTLGLASIGYVLWALRGGMFLATMYAGIPTWRTLDPSTILSTNRGGLSEDRVEAMMRKEKTGNGR
ncbi:MAG: hypothetical protein AAF745_15825, partial [Planctomycetota bacterium]